MLKSILLTLPLSVSLFARESTQGELNDIYFEAILFMAIFGTMGIISFIISRKHAKEYVPKELIVEDNETDRISELLQMCRDGLLSKKEFEILKKYLK